MLASYTPDAMKAPPIGGDRLPTSGGSLAGGNFLAVQPSGSPPGEMMINLYAFVNAFPPYGYSGWGDAHRGALVNLLESRLPNDAIAPQPDEYGYGYMVTYGYSGPYKGYADAFFGGVAAQQPA